MESVNQEVNADGESQINITDLLLDYLANWKWFVLSLVVCIAAAVLYIATRIPVYQIDASIYLSEDNSSGQNAFNLSNAADPMVAFKNYIDETELEVLKSRNNLLKIVDSLQLAYSYYKKVHFAMSPFMKTMQCRLRCQRAICICSNIPLKSKSRRPATVLVISKCRHSSIR